MALARIFPLLILPLLLLSCETDPREEASLDAAPMDTVSQAYLPRSDIRTRAVERLPDSLIAYIQQLESTLEEARRENAEPTGPAVRPKVKIAVNKFIKAWEDLGENQDPETILQFFSPQFNVTLVQVDTNAAPRIVQANAQLFKRRLKALVRRESFDIKFGPARYLYADLSGEVFTIAFKTRASNYENGRLTFRSDNLISLTGRLEEPPLIADLHWIDVAVIE